MPHDLIHDQLGGDTSNLFSATFDPAYNHQLTEVERLYVTWKKLMLNQSTVLVLKGNLRPENTYSNLVFATYLEPTTSFSITKF